MHPLVTLVSLHSNIYKYEAEFSVYSKLRLQVAQMAKISTDFCVKGLSKHNK